MLVHCKKELLQSGGVDEDLESDSYYTWTPVVKEEIDDVDGLPVNIVVSSCRISAFRVSHMLSIQITINSFRHIF